MNWDTIGDGFKVSTSAGVNQLRPDEAPDDVLTRADVSFVPGQECRKKSREQGLLIDLALSSRPFRSGGVEMTAPAPPSLTPGRFHSLSERQFKVEGSGSHS